MEIGVHGVGMVTALGLDWRTCCAAGRAGVSRAEPIEYFRVQANDPWEIEKVVGHRVTLLTYGFEAYGRFTRLLAGALSDLVQQGLAPLGESNLYLSLPDIATETLDLGPEESTSEAFRIGIGGQWRKRERWEQLVQSSATLAKWPGRLRLAGLSFLGPSGVMRLVQQYQVEVGSRAAVIAAVDSLLEEAQLLQFHVAKRLKTKADPVGLMPGEAAVAILLGGAADAKAVIGSIAFAPAEGLDESCSPESGVRLAQLIERSGANRWPGEGSPWIFSDHNGEGVRSQLWGSALHRLSAKQAVFRSAALWYPAASFGDTGVSGPAIAMALAMAAWNRAYAPSAACCAVAASPSAERAAIVLRRPN